MSAVPSAGAMGVSGQAPERRGGDAAVYEKLDGWKEIAAYLGRTVRTVQRWERMEGLPVLRHQHAKRATVYAYRHEVDRWWQEERTVATESRRGDFLFDGPSIDPNVPI